MCLCQPARLVVPLRVHEWDDPTRDQAQFV
jgi:hypothetical protein